MYLDIKATTREVIVENRNGVWLTRTVWRKSEGKMRSKQCRDDRCGFFAQERSRCQEIDKDYKENLEMEEHVVVPKRVYITREDLEVFGFTSRCAGWMSLLKWTARQSHKENRGRRIEVELRGIVEAEAAQRRVKEYQDEAGVRKTERTKLSLEEGVTDAPTTTTTTIRRSGSQVLLSPWLRHEQQSIAAVLATVTHHSFDKVGTASGVLRNRKTATRTGEGGGEREEVHGQVPEDSSPASCSHRVLPDDGRRGW